MCVRVSSRRALTKRPPVIGRPSHSRIKSPGVSVCVRACRAVPSSLVAPLCRISRALFVRTALFTHSEASVLYYIYLLYLSSMPYLCSVLSCSLFARRTVVIGASQTRAPATLRSLIVTLLPSALTELSQRSLVLGAAISVSVCIQRAAAHLQINRVQYSRCVCCVLCAVRIGNCTQTEGKHNRNR